MTLTYTDIDRINLFSYNASPWHNIALVQGNNMPRRGKKWCVLSYWRNWRICLSSDASYRILISFYSSPFTFSPETPINTGVSGGEECPLTLHHSSPLFTLCAGFETCCCIGIKCLRSNHSCRTLASFSAHHRSDAYRQSYGLKCGKCGDLHKRGTKNV